MFFQPNLQTIARKKQITNQLTSNLEKIVNN